jgi:hypothetical protein
MSEENTQATTETVSESPAKETTQEALIEKLKAEQAYSKSQRQKKQDAQNRLAELESKLAKLEEDKLKKKEEYKTLYEKVSSENESLTANSEKWAKYEKAKRASLLELHSESERENLYNLDLETLEYVTSKINSVKPNAPEKAGQARKSVPKAQLKDFQKMTKQERKENWANYMKQYEKK